MDAYLLQRPIALLYSIADFVTFSAKKSLNDITVFIICIASAALNSWRKVGLLT
jgi:hypothetical protein